MGFTELKSCDAKGYFQSIFEQFFYNENKDIMF